MLNLGRGSRAGSKFELKDLGRGGAPFGHGNQQRARCDPFDLPDRVCGTDAGEIRHGKHENDAISTDVQRADASNRDVQVED